MKTETRFFQFFFFKRIEGLSSKPEHCMWQNFQKQIHMILFSKNITPFTIHYILAS